MISSSQKALRPALKPAECFLYSTRNRVNIVVSFLIGVSGILSCSPTNQNEAELSTANERQIADSTYIETTNTPMEILIMIQDNATKEEQQRIAELTVLQEISPRVKVIEGSNEITKEINKLSGVTLLTEETWNEALAQSLTEVERLFVEAWQLKQQLGTKQRPGEGAPWDDPNFQPPDSLPEK